MPAPPMVPLRPIGPLGVIIGSAGLNEIDFQVNSPAAGVVHRRGGAEPSAASRRPRGLAPCTRFTKRPVRRPWAYLARRQCFRCKGPLLCRGRDRKNRDHPRAKRPAEFPENSRSAVRFFTVVAQTTKIVLPADARFDRGATNVAAANRFWNRPARVGRPENHQAATGRVYRRYGPDSSHTVW
jgi:hypothetical protein